jgi:hypothetical protein
MKFVLENRQTWDLIHDFERLALEIKAGFFFNFRGTPLQKSLEGVLRSLIKQILEKCLHDHSPLLWELEKKGFLKPDWVVSVPELERCLAIVIEQQICKLDLSIFFDALDEFDGHHNLICAFLKRLSNVPPQSLTRLRLCFSSRPWEIFKKNFGHCPGLKVQDYTQDDIRDYCASMILSLRTDHPSMLELIPTMVARADGVFLWVKLVIAQIANRLLSDANLSTTQLQEIMDSLPSELDKFYDYIIQRIPHSLRWKTYALLELITRSSSSSDRGLVYVTLSVLISGCAGYDQACKEIYRFLSEHGGVLNAQNIANWSGGLVDVLEGEVRTPGESKPATVQLMHQTVYEFATSMKFKQRVLGDRAKTEHENGHSFHAKSRLVANGQLEGPLAAETPELIATGILEFPVCSENDTVLGMSRSDRGSLKSSYHAREAEATTGRSQKEFLDSLHTSPLHNIAFSLEVPTIKSHLGLAVHDGLQLYIRDALEENPAILTRTREKLFACIFARYEYEWSICYLLETLLANGFSMHEKVNMLVPLLARAWRLTPDPVTDADNHGGTTEQIYYQGHTTELEKGVDNLCEIYFFLLNKGLDVNEDITTLPSHVPELHPLTAPLTYYSVLHLAPPAIALRLLQQGFDPNILDSEGQTPLDWILRSQLAPKVEDGRSQYLFWALEKCVMLVNFGGHPATTTIDEWIWALPNLHRSDGCKPGNIHFLDQKYTEWTQRGFLRERSVLGDEPNPRDLTLSPNELTISSKRPTTPLKKLREKLQIRFSKGGASTSKEHR